MARSAARSICSILRAAASLGRQDVHQEFGVALDDHEEIVEVVGDATGEAPDGFHFLGLAKLLFELMALADVLRDDEVDGAAVVFELVGDDFGFDDAWPSLRDVLPVGFVARATFATGEGSRGRRRGRPGRMSRTVMLSNSSCE